MASINEIKHIIRIADVCGHVPLIKGLHGLGKSEAVRQYKEDQQMHMETLILSIMDTGDMIGLPTTENIGGLQSTTWAAPSWYTNIVNAAWPEILKFSNIKFTDTDFCEYVHKGTNPQCEEITRENLNFMYCTFYSLPNNCLQLLRQNHVSYLGSKRSILFLDEFNRAPIDVLNASLQLILDHRIHSHVLPLGTLIVAAINPANGNYTAQELDPALLDRFVECEVEPDFKAWYEWAKAHNVNKIVLDFLMDNQRKLHFSPEDNSKGASPRSWVRLAAYLDKLEDTSKEVFTHYVKGTIGSALAAQFVAFYNSYSTALSSADLEKEMKKVITAARKKGENNPQVIAKYFEEQVTTLEAIRRQDFADTFVEKYINETPANAMPLLVYLYALPLESLSAVLKTIQTKDAKNYAKLVILDKELNNKQLFVKLVSNLKGK